MAQLTDDCFAFSGPLLRLEEMKRLIGDRISPVRETEFVPLHGACGRVTAADLKAPVNLPPFENSAVDGYAVRHADLNRDSDTRLRLSGRLTAGASARIGLGAAEAIRIFTGAAMPDGADTVFMQEDVRLEGDHVVVPKGLKLGSNRRIAGGGCVGRVSGFSGWNSHATAARGARGRAWFGGNCCPAAAQRCNFFDRQ